MEGPRTREVIEDYAEKNNLGDPRTITISDLIDHANERALLADRVPETHHYTAALELNDLLKQGFNLTNNDLNNQLSAEAQQNLGIDVANTLDEKRELMKDSIERDVSEGIADTFEERKALMDTMKIG